ncbi:MAG: hypothetical protein NUV65_06175 [Candidatus Roizmanbacteria bacterium]|nr:hypothetical protein [Candidatus Roizmanbacteria bacterium]
MTVDQSIAVNTNPTGAIIGSRERNIHEYVPLLAEVDLLMDADNTWEEEIVTEGIYANELCGLVEGIDKEGMLLYTSLLDEQLCDFVVGGQVMGRILGDGIEYCMNEERTATGSRKKVLGIEVERRKYEQEEHERFVDLVREGRAEDHVQIIVSPFPEEAARIDPQAVKALGYDLEKKTWKVRGRWYDGKSKKMTTVEFLAKNSSLEKINQFLKDAFHINLPARHTNDILYCPFLKEKEEYQNWQSFFNHIAPFLHTVNEPDVIVERAKRMIQTASPLAEQLTMLDKELAESLKSGQPSPIVQALIQDYRALGQLGGHSSEHFTRQLAARIKELSIITALVELAIKTGNTDNLRGFERLVAQQDINQDELRAFIARNPVEYVVCGSTLKSGSAYSWGIDTVKVVLFGSEKRVATCPLCQHENALDSSHIAHGIACWSCGAKVPSGEASECIVLTARAAGIQNKNTPPARYSDETNDAISIELPVMADA